MSKLLKTVNDIFHGGIAYTGLLLLSTVFFYLSFFLALW